MNTELSTDAALFKCAHNTEELARQDTEDFAEDATALQDTDDFLAGCAAYSGETGECEACQ